MKVLIADDDKATREELANLCKTIFLDCELVTVNDCWEALQKIKKYYFDLIIAAFHTPFVGGIEVLLKAQEVYGVSKARVILLTYDPKTLFSEVKRQLGEEVVNEVKRSFLEKKLKPMIDGEDALEEVRRSLLERKLKPAIDPENAEIIIKSFMKGHGYDV